MLPQLLRNMADYLEKKTYPWIHPREKPLEPKIYKRQYNLLVKKMAEKGETTPALPRRKRKMSQKLRQCFVKYEIDPHSPHLSETKTKLSKNL